MAMISTSSNTSKGAAGRPFLSLLIETTLANMATPTQPKAPTLQINSLTNIPESASSSPSTDHPSDRSKLRLNMYRKIRPPPFRHAWCFYHEKSAQTADTTAPYEERLTTMLEDIITIKTFWELLNQFPLQNLRMRDSIHFFKRSVQPVWEDPRNVEGGAWTFRVHKDVSGEFWKEVLLMAVGEQFAEVLGKGDDICGLSLSRRHYNDIITVWNRRAGNQSTVNGIRDVVLAQLSEGLKPRENSFYYKPHSEHKDFSKAVAAAKKAKGGEMERTEVEEAEAEMVMLKEAEEEGGGIKVEESGKGE